MKIPDIIIAIDGCSSTGKSTFAKLAASRFAFLYLDSGAMYRGVTLAGMEKGIVRDGQIDLPALQALLDGGLDLHFRHEDGKTLLYLGDRLIESEIRTLAVSGNVSPVSAVPFVRRFVDDKLHAFSKGGRVIMDGRDIGTTVFPNAELKIFMTAAPEIRAQRRYDELIAKGEQADFQQVLENLRERDRIDSTRAVAPLRQADDALVLDNSHLTIPEQKQWLLDRFIERTHPQTP